VHTYQIHSNRISSGDSQTPLHLPLGINNYTSELNSRDATGFYQLPPVVLRYSRPVSYISTGESRYFWPNCRSLRRSRVVRPSPVSTAMSVTSALLIFRSTCLPSIPLIRLSSPRSWTHNIHSLVWIHRHANKRMANPRIEYHVSFPNAGQTGGYQLFPSRP
jgi:hypothetical protein